MASRKSRSSFPLSHSNWCLLITSRIRNSQRDKWYSITVIAAIIWEQRLGTIRIVGHSQISFSQVALLEIAWFRLFGVLGESIWHNFEILNAAMLSLSLYINSIKTIQINQILIFFDFFGIFFRIKTSCERLCCVRTIHRLIVIKKKVAEVLERTN